MLDTVTVLAVLESITDGVTVIVTVLGSLSTKLEVPAETVGFGSVLEKNKPLIIQQKGRVLTEC